MSILTGKLSRFASLELRTVSFLEVSKPLLHHLIDIMVLVPHASEHRDKWIPLTKTLQALFRSPPNRSEIEERCVELLKKLEDGWIKFGSKTYMSQLLPEYSSVEEPLTPPIAFPNTFTAFTYSVFNATVIVLRTALVALSSSHSHSVSLHIGGNQTKLMLSHCGYILEIATFHGSKCPMGLDFMRSTFPVKIVEMLSLSEEQRIQAKEVTES